jgi:hypothetical protein
VDVLTATAAERPDLAARLNDFNPWPTFMRHDPVGSVYYVDPVEAYPEYVLAAVDRDRPTISSPRATACRYLGSGSGRVPARGPVGRRHRLFRP